MRRKCGNHMESVMETDIIQECTGLTTHLVVLDSVQKHRIGYLTLTST